MRVFLYIESPYQLANAINYLEFDNTYTCREILVRDNGNQTQTKQLKNLLRKSKLDNATFFYCPGGGVGRLLALPLLILKLLLKSFVADTVVVGDARPLVVRGLLGLTKLMKKKVVLVDDGLYLLNYVNKIKNETFFLYTNLPIRNKLHGQVSKLRVHEVASKPAKLNDKDEKSIGFIGMKLVEIGFISYDEYFFFLKKVKNSFDGYNLKYYSHREEDDSKLDEISSMGFKVVKSDISIEEYIYEYGGDHSYVTFYSTALFNVRKMLPSANCSFIRPTLGTYPKSHQKNIDLCYELFDAAGINEFTGKL